MKKILIACIFSALMSQQIAAIGFGLFGGLNISDVSNLGEFTGASATQDGVTIAIDSLDSDTKLRSFLIGAYLETDLGIPILGMRYEAVYVRKGLELHTRGSTFAGESLTTLVGPFDTTLDTKYELTYLDIPVLLQLSKSFSQFRPFLFAGPAFSIFLSGSSTATLNIRALDLRETIESDDVRDFFSSSVYVSLLAGGGFGYKFSPFTEISVSFRYLLGLTDRMPGTTGSQQFREINIVFGLGFKI